MAGLENNRIVIDATDTDAIIILNDTEDQQVQCFMSDNGEEQGDPIINSLPIGKLLICLCSFKTGQPNGTSLILKPCILGEGNQLRGTVRRFEHHLTLRGWLDVMIVSILNHALSNEEAKELGTPVGYSNRYYKFIKYTPPTMARELDVRRPQIEKKINLWFQDGEIEMQTCCRCYRSCVFIDS